MTLNSTSAGIDCTIGIVVLSMELKKRYIDKLTQILDRKRDYKARTGIRRADGYQRMEEITIMKTKCIELKDFILNAKLPALQIPYRPLLRRNHTKNRGDLAHLSN